MESFLPNYKQVSTSRGFQYRYYFSAPASGQPTLLLVHGFPSLAIDWHNQITYFKAKGYGLVVPDMLGYGGTDKPEDVAAYPHTLLAKDLIDILDHEKINNVIAIGHDWGSKTTSVLANLYGDRFKGFGFFALGYVAPNTVLTHEEFQNSIKNALGRETFGYWDFFTAPDAEEVIFKHIESFWDILHPRDPRILRTNVASTGSLRIFLESDSRTPRSSFASEEQQRIREQEFSKGGFKAPLNYYHHFVGGAQMEDSKKIPVESYKIIKPVFFGGAIDDEVCVAALQLASTTKFCPQTTVEHFKAGHWVMLEVPEKVNMALDKWINGIVA